MPSRSRRLAALALVATAVGLAALGAWTLVARSGIPRAWDGVVTAVDVRAEKHPGVDDVWFVSVDGDATHVDAALGRTLGVGDRVEKRRWSRTLLVNGSPRALELSGDARRMLVLAPLVAAAAGWLALAGARA